MQTQNAMSQSKGIAKQMLDALSAANTQAASVKAFKKLSHLIQETPLFQQMLTNPLVKPTQKKYLMHHIFDKLKIVPQLTIFFDQIIELGLAKLMPSIIEQFIEQYNVQNHRYVAEVITTKPLKKDMLADIRSGLEKHIKGEILIDEKVDPDILGGFIVKINGKLFDASLRRELSFIAQSLKGITQ